MKKRGVLTTQKYLAQNRIEMIFIILLVEIVFDFFLNSNQFLVDRK